MSFQLSKPSLLLKNYVKQYWSIENQLLIGESYLHRIIPSGLTELMFYFDDKPAVLDNKKDFSGLTILSGQQSSYYDLKVRGRLNLFSISFLPHSISMLFNIPASELFNQNVPLSFILGNRVVELETRLHEAPEFSEKVKVVEGFLYKQLKSQYNKFEFNRICKSLNIINQSKGLVAIDKLASEICLSRKQFERTFMDYIGMSPKKFLKTVRFQNALYQKQINQNSQLTELSYKCGYYDQSHMISDFKSLSGKTPRQFFSECEPFSDYFQ